MIIYIAGKITGLFEFKKKFTKTERYLKSLGHIVLNPAYLPQGLNDYMPTCKALIDQADAVYFLNNWTDSPGANEEHIYARQKQKILIFEGKIEKISIQKELEYWNHEAVKATAELREIKFKIAEATKKAGANLE